MGGSGREREERERERERERRNISVKIKENVLKYYKVPKCRNPDITHS